MIESAPLQINFIYPCEFLTITLILFLVELNSSTFKSSNVSSEPFGFLIIMLLFESLPIKVYPKYLAAFTRANSSGEEAL